MEQLSEYFLIMTRPNQTPILRPSIYEPKYTPPTRWEMAKDILSQLGEYVIMGVLYIAYILCISIGFGLLLSNITSL